MIDKFSQIKIPKKIKKRDGRIVDFEKGRVVEAVFKAFEASGQPDRALAEDVAQITFGKLSQKYLPRGKAGKKNISKAIPFIEELQDIVEESLVEKGFAKVAKSYILYRQKRAELRREKQEILEKTEIDEIDKMFDSNALRVLKSRYLRKNTNGKIIESPKQLFQRVAIHIVLAEIVHDKRVSLRRGKEKTGEEGILENEKAIALENCLRIGGYFLNRFHVKGLYHFFSRFEKEGRTKISWEDLVRLLKNNQFSSYQKKIDEFYELMVSRDFMPNTPALANFGSYLGMGSACFALDIGDSIDSIMETLKRASIIFKSGGGLGYNFSKLRPEGDFIKTTGGTSSGPLSFMRLFDTMTNVVKQGGIRRGANMGIMNSNHPDIEKFVVAKEGNEALTNFNISVLIMPDFWDCYKKDKPYPLENPRTGEIQRQVSPKVLFENIVYHAWESAEPGVLFYEKINEFNPLLKELGPIVTTNPCVPDNTWVMTSSGPRQVKELIGQKTEVVVGGKKWSNRGQGFFHTGDKRLLNLKTKEGFSMSLTGNHLVRKVKKLTRYAMDCEWLPAVELKIGDKVALNFNENFSWGGQYGGKEGYLLGHLVGDGVIWRGKAFLESWGESKGEKKVRTKIEDSVKSFPHRVDFKGWVFNKSGDKYRITSAAFSKLVEDFDISNKKIITPFVERESSDFYKGFLRGFFDTDGSVQGSQLKGVSVRLAQSDIERLEAVQRMLLRLGIFSKIYTNRRPAGFRKMPDGHGGLKSYFTKANHELVISGENLERFYKRVGFENLDKSEKLEKLLKKYRRMLNKERFFATVSEIVKSEIKKVYDIQIPGINAFDANGFYVHNCGELLLYPNESCNLGSINLWNFVKICEDEKKDIDWEKLEKTVRLAVRFLDNIIDVNHLPLVEIEDMTFKTRKIGLGVMGLGDLFFELELPYNSPAGRDLMEKIAEFINYHSKLESVKLAREKGAFPLFKKSFYAEGKLPFAGFYDKKSWNFDWKEVADKIKKYGIRNSYTTVIAPTGSTSMIAGCSSGIEPVYSLVYQKNVAVGSFYYIDAVFEQAMLREGLFDENLITDVVMAKGSVQEINYIPPRLKKFFVTSHDIKPEDHIKTLASFQKWVDSSISKTINFPKEATVGDMKKAYLLAHELGCKGVTVYRDTSIKGQVLNTASEKSKRADRGDGLQRIKDEKAEGLVVYRDASTVYLNGNGGESATDFSGNKAAKCPNCKIEVSFKEGCASCPVCGWGLCA
ncbi:ribonucleoside reductase class II [Patescibacteria group bacterium]|nr:ribonucleoside reductase class II [Patescibacteria group bacterium]